MLKRLKHAGNRTAQAIHLRFFGYGMGDNMKDFLYNLSWSFLGGTIASGLLFVATVLSGRWLGPTEYGKVGFIQALALSLSTLLLFGLDIASVRALSRAKSEEAKKNYMSSSLVSFFIIGVGVIIILFALTSPLADLLGTTRSLFSVAIGFALMMGLKNLVDGYLRGLHDFRHQSYTKIAESGLIVIGFVLLFIVMKPPTYISFIGPVIAGGVLFVIINALRLRRFFHISSASFTVAHELASYSKFVTLASLISLIVLQGDKVIVNRYLGTYELGIYTAYYTAAVLPISQVVTIIGNVFFPIIAKADNKQSVIKKLDRMLLLSLIPLTALISLGTLMVLLIFGKSYPVIPIHIMLFGLFGTLIFFSSFYTNMVNAHSKQTFAWGIGQQAIKAAAFVAYIAILLATDSFSVTTLLYGLVGSYIFDIFNNRAILKRFALTKPMA